ncbi:flagellar assembly protein FliH [Thermodesulfobium acidiphilum]|uniref:Flagellar assembly protein FliH n=1 Tax=Thermodesulfobium acidiphilum TaxID=1794699 RepID=A0A2R4VYM2_THEAF|nr:FliH/SctL family protein [Thermodesulfobium acidiphilum]AWB09550.1 flagellar assembly protein FliH [Thermodesulfobium acidiphilum]
MKIKNSRVLKNVYLGKECFVVPVKQQTECSEPEALSNNIDKKEETVDKEDIINKAMSEIEMLKENARKDGFELGYKEGMKKAQEEIEAKEKEWLQVFKENILKLEKENKEYLDRVEKRLEEEAFNIVVKSVSQILHSNLLKDVEILKERIRAFLREIPPSVEIKIKVSKDDAERFYGFELPVEVDPVLKSGDFMIKTDLGFLDGRIKSLEDDFIKELKRIFE